MVNLKHTAAPPKLLWLGWCFMVIGLFLAIITIPEGDPHIGSILIFLGMHDGDAYGLHVALALTNKYEARNSPPVTCSGGVRPIQ
jgi:hypothetical protein